MRKSPSKKVIRALYAAAAAILDPNTEFSPCLPSICMIGQVAKQLGADNERGGVMPPVIREGVPEHLVDRIFCSVMATREEGAKMLRDLADDMVLRLRRKSKMNVRALLLAARQIEDNPESYYQSRGSGLGLLGRVAIANGGACIDHRRLGLTDAQHSKLFWFMGTWNESGKRFNYKHLDGSGRFGTSLHYRAIDDLPAEKRAKIAVNRLRRMAIYGT